MKKLFGLSFILLVLSGGVFAQRIGPDRFRPVTRTSVFRVNLTAIPDYYRIKLRRTRLFGPRQSQLIPVPAPVKIRKIRKARLIKIHRRYLMKKRLIRLKHS